MNKDYERLFADLVASSAKQAGFTIAALAPGEAKAPVLSMAYSRAARRQRVSPQTLLDSDLARVRGSEYPTRECLRPHHIDEFARGGKLPATAKAHAEGCKACAALVAGLTINQERLSDFLRAVQRRTAEQSIGAPKPRNRPANSSDADRADGQDLTAIDVVMRALIHLAAAVDAEPDRRTVFRRLIEIASLQFGGYDGWHLDLVTKADELKLAPWAVECLPTLYIELAAGGRHAVVWHYVLASIPINYKCHVISELCQGIAYELTMPEQTAELIKRLSPLFELSRNGNKFPSSQSMRAVALEAMQACQRSLRGDEATAIELAKENMLRSDALIPDFNGVINALELLAHSRRESDSVLLDDLCTAITTLYPEDINSLADTAAKKGIPALAAAIRSHS